MFENIIGSAVVPNRRNLLLVSES